MITSQLERHEISIRSLASAFREMRSLRFRISGGESDFMHLSSCSGSSRAGIDRAGLVELSAVWVTEPVKVRSEYIRLLDQSWRAKESK